MNSAKKSPSLYYPKNEHPDEQPLDYMPLKHNAIAESEHQKPSRQEQEQKVKQKGDVRRTIKKILVTAGLITAFMAGVVTGKITSETQEAKPLSQEAWEQEMQSQVDAINNTFDYVNLSYNDEGSLVHLVHTFDTMGPSDLNGFSPNLSDEILTYDCYDNNNDGSIDRIEQTRSRIKEGEADMVLKNETMDFDNKALGHDVTISTAMNMINIRN